MTTRLGVRRWAARAVLAVGLACVAGSAGASEGRVVSGDCPPVSRDRYRVLPEESEVAFAVLPYHLDKHPPQGAESLCVTMPGYKALPEVYAKQLATPSRHLDPDPNCRFQRGRHVVAAEGVWRLKDGRYIVDVRLLEFDDISRSLALSRYTVTRTASKLSIETGLECQR